MSTSPWQVMHSLTRDGSVAETKLPPGTARRVLSYARPIRAESSPPSSSWWSWTPCSSSPHPCCSPGLWTGVIPRDRSVVTVLAAIVAGIAVLDAVVSVISRWYSARIGEGLIYDLRTKVFSHVLRQPIAFFTRAQTGALVSRVNNDVIGAQQAFTSVLSSVVEQCSSRSR
jgi:ATP-binding cassette subfamily B protein